MQRDQGDQERQVVAAIQKSDRLSVEVALVTWRGKRFVDFRTSVINSAGERVLTPKGFMLEPQQVDQLEEALERVRDASDETTHPPF